MCDCDICNMTEEGQREWEEKYIEWEYEQYKETTDNPLTIDDWLKTLEVPK